MKPSPELEAHLREFYGALWPQVRDAISSGMADPIQFVKLSAMLREHIGPDLERLFGRGYDSAAVVVPSFNVKPQEAMRFLETYRIKLAQSITDTLNTKLTTALRSGLDAGESIPEIRNRIEAEWPEVTKRKAEIVAQTETARAQGEGRLASWVGQGVKAKEWLLSPAPCELCVAIWSKGPIPPTQPFFALGETIVGDSGKVFTNDYMDVNAQPAHPECHCSVGAIFEE